MMDDCHNDDAAIQNCSPLFASPCVILGRKANGKCADIWALGVTLYCFVHGYCPFEDFSPVVLTEMILRDKPKYKKELSKSLVDLLESMLQKSSKSRITIAKMKVHLWVTDNGKKPMKTIEENCLTETITDEDMEKAFQPAKMSMSQVFYFNVDV
jgi:[calcium/calmodulin-dependent protein kinase] kinase